MTVRVIIVNTEACGELLAEPKRFCSAARLTRCSVIRSEEVRLQGYAAELALSYALSGTAFEPPQYYYGSNGKPCIDNGCISLSHSGKYAVCAYADLPVGVDIEAARAVDPRIARRVLSPAELIKFEKTGKDYLLDRFVMKEAYLKMTGEGVFSRPYEVYECEGSVFRSGVRAGYYYSVPLDGYHLAVVSSAETEIEPYELHP